MGGDNVGRTTKHDRKNKKFKKEEKSKSFERGDGSEASYAGSRRTNRRPSPSGAFDEHGSYAVTSSAPRYLGHAEDDIGPLDAGRLSPTTGSVMSAASGE